MAWLAVVDREPVGNVDAGAVPDGAHVAASVEIVAPLLEHVLAVRVVPLRMRVPVLNVLALFATVPWNPAAPATDCTRRMPAVTTSNPTARCDRHDVDNTYPGPLLAAAQGMGCRSTPSLSCRFLPAGELLLPASAYWWMLQLIGTVAFSP